MPNYEEIIALWQPQQANLWNVTLEGVSEFTGGPDTLSLAIAKISLPKESTEEIQVPYQNTFVWFAGSTKIETFSISFRDYVDKNVAAAIIAWRKRIFDNITGAGWLARDYKKTGRITLWSPDFTSFTRVWSIRGAWPVSASYGDLSFDSSEQIMIDVTLRVDKAVAENGFAASPYVPPATL
jgi:hypothetical protein